MDFPFSPDNARTPDGPTAPSGLAPLDWSVVTVKDAVFEAPEGKAKRITVTVAGRGFSFREYLFLTERSLWKLKSLLMSLGTSHEAWKAEAKAQGVPWNHAGVLETVFVGRKFRARFAADSYTPYGQKVAVEARKITAYESCDPTVAKTQNQERQRRHRARR